jgi:hypothetical protein
MLIYWGAHILGCSYTEVNMTSLLTTTMVTAMVSPFHYELIPQFNFLLASLVLKQNRPAPVLPSHKKEAWPPGP